MKKIIKIFKSKIIFKRPERKNFLILDSVQSDIFKNYINLNEVNFLDTRYESLNIFIILKMIMKFKFSYYDYICEYIKFSNCKTVISFFDNYVSYLRLKQKFPLIRFIFIQNGMRTSFFFENLKKYSDLKVDYLLTFNDFYSQKFQEVVRGKFISIGSFKNNQIRNLFKKKNKVISFVSSGPFNSANMKIYEKLNINNDKYFNPEKRILPVIYKFCAKNSLDFQILSRSKDKENLIFEKNFYDEILKDCNYKFIDTSEKNKIYEISDNSLITVSIYSAFGLESLARGNKTVIFNLRNKATNFESLSLFWGYETGKNGFFWTDKIDEKNVFEVLNNVINCSNTQWNSHVKEIKPFLVNFDENNSKFKSLLNE